VGAASSRARAANEVWQKSDLIQPEELAAILNHPNQEKPVIVFIGFDFLFRAAHIPGSLYFGPGSKASGVESLKRWASGINKNKAVVLYCGCCPWRQCPNVRPAFQAARAAGLKRVKVLYLPDSLVRDWIDKGYPVEKGK
jgi:3-mercaptopyruvate sulfurtransferase SseA